MRLIRSQRLSGKEDTGIVGSAVLKIEQTWWGSVAWRRNHFLSTHGLFTAMQNKASHDKSTVSIISIMCMSSVYFLASSFLQILATPNRSNQSKEESVVATSRWVLHFDKYIHSQSAISDELTNLKHGMLKFTRSASAHQISIQLCQALWLSFLHYNLSRNTHCHNDCLSCFYFILCPSLSLSPDTRFPWAFIRNTPDSPASIHSPDAPETIGGINCRVSESEKWSQDSSALSCHSIPMASTGGRLHWMQKEKWWYVRAWENESTWHFKQCRPR